MNVFKIAWRSIQHRGLGSILTILSMALGVMMVVAVLSIHGVVSESFRSNNSFGYNVLVGARGGGLQLTLNTVYYLSKPVENIPYEYYLAFCDRDTRNREMKNSIAYQARTQAEEAWLLSEPLGFSGSGLGSSLASALLADAFSAQQDAAMGITQGGMYNNYTHMAVPLCQGDYYVDPETNAKFRCVGTTPNFFTDLVLDIETEEQFKFAQGRAFVESSPEHGFFECVVGSLVAKRCDIRIGDKIQATHGDPDSSGAHIHEQDYTVVGIIESTGTPHDRVVFLNMEGFYLMEDHAKNIEDDSVLGRDDDEDVDAEDLAMQLTDDYFEDDDEVDEQAAAGETGETVASQQPDNSSLMDPKMLKKLAEAEQLTPEEEFVRKQNATRIPLPIEQREVTSIVVRTSNILLGEVLPAQINEQNLESTLSWTPYRPEQAQKAAQAVNPIDEIVKLFQVFVDPIRWLLLALTSMICVVSALSILVGIYNSMSQRQHEIAVMRALGASRTKVMLIMLCESILLAVAGGLLGWLAGHTLNAALSSIVESRTGVALKFWDVAPAVSIESWTFGFLPEFIGAIEVSPEILLIPGLVLLAVLVGLYPAFSAYRTDVSKSLGK